MEPMKSIKKISLPTGVLGISQIAGTAADDSGSMIAGCIDGVYRVTLGDMPIVEKIDEHESYVSSTELIDGTVVSAGYDGALQWFDLSERKRVRRNKLHQFWSWDMKVSPDKNLIASVTGQYLAGGYKYEPLPEREPSVVLLDAESGKVIHQFSHVPSVQAVAFSPNSRFVAAGNLMGEIRVWDTDSGEMVSNWMTSDFTSWGIIKSHSYLGGVFAMEFSPSGEEIVLAGMGPMRDPMAGNGKQRWQKWAWRDNPKKTQEINKGQAGEGLMEALTFAPDGKHFAMGGRLRGGDWNVGVFDSDTGNREQILKTGFRVTELRYTTDQKHFVVAGARSQPKNQKDGKFPDFGVIEMFSV